MRKTPFGALVAAVAVALVASPAQARPEKIRVASEVSIEDFTLSPGAVTFFGFVESRSVCEKRRRVRLEQTTDMITAGRDRTNPNGGWSITHATGKAFPLRVFEATVEKRVVKGGGTGR
jgi:hypothetical protein